MIHETAIIHPNVALGKRTHVGPFCILGDEDSHAPPLVIGDDAIIRAGTIIYGGPVIRDGLQTGHHSLIRGDVQIGHGLRIGSFSSIEGKVRVGNDVRIQGRCEVADAFIHDRARLYIHAVITDMRHPPDGIKMPPTIGEDAVLYANVLVIAGVRIGKRAHVAGGAIVHKDVPDDHLLTRKGELRPR